MRDDYLASVCIVDEESPDETVPQLAALNESLARDFRYFEIIYVVAERTRDRLDPFVDTLAQLPNLRILVTSDGASFYRQRVIAASEAIGDVVAVIDLADLNGDALSARLNEARDGNQILLGWRVSHRSPGVLYRMLSLLSRSAVTNQASRTIILARERLDAVLARDNASVDLRFEPRRGPARYRRFPLTGPATRRGPLSHHRYELLTEILLAGAPRYLKIYAGLGFLATLGAALYATYAILVLLLHPQVQEGWFSTAFLLAGSTGFVSAGISILSIALVAILEKMSDADDRMIVDEITNISLFDQLTDRNVEIWQAAVGGSETREH